MAENQRAIRCSTPLSVFLPLLPMNLTGNTWKILWGGLHSEPLKTSVKSSHIPLETEKWGEFRVGDLFDVQIAKSSDIDSLDDGQIKFIGRTDVDNGTQGFVSVTSDKIVKHGCLTVSMVGTNVALWQDADFTCSQNIAVLRAQKLSVASALFIVSILNMDMRCKYSYGRTISKDKLRNTCIKLPQTPDGEPDWKWMEDYMRSLPYSDLIAA